MMRPSLVAVAALCTATTLAAAGGGPVFMPAKDRNTVLDPLGFTVHLAPHAAPVSEIVAPCGAPLPLPPSAETYFWWLEGDLMVSPRLFVFRFIKDSQGPTRPIHGAVVPAGVVIPEQPLEDHHTFRVLQLDTAFSRQVTAERARSGVLIPAGPVVTAIYDEKDERYLALSRPKLLGARRTEVFAPRPPSSPASDLLVVFTIADRRAIEHMRDLSPRLTTTDGRVVRPDVSTAGDGFLGYAIWYGLADKQVRLFAESPTAWAHEQDILLRPGQVEAVTVTMLTKPKLAARLLVPEELSKQGGRIEVTDENAQHVVSREVPAGTTEIELGRVPAARLSLVLRLGPWAFREPVDLTEGLDETVTFDPEVHRVSGRVLRGSRPIPARFRLASGIGRGDPSTYEFETDEEGRYSVTLFKRGVFPLYIDPLDRPNEPPFLTALRVKGDAEEDFVLPSARFSVTVRSARDGRPIANARVSVRSTSEDGASSGRTVQTGEDGKVDLPALEPGTAEIAASADGFTTSRISETVGEDEERDIELRLRPRDDAWRVRVRLTDGRAADGARLFLAASLDGAPLWAGTCDSLGEATVPRAEPGTMLAIAHAAAGLTISRDLPIEDGERTIVLAPPAAPLSLRAVDRARNAVSQAGLRIWVDEQRLGSHALRHLFGAPDIFDGAGHWSGAGFSPGARIAVLAWARVPDIARLALTGQLDAQRTTLPLDRPGVVTIEALH